MANEIWIVPFFGQSHLFPLMELCKHLASRNFKAVFVISSEFSSSIPSSLRQYPLVEIAEISEAPPSDSSSPPQEPSSQPLHKHHARYSQIAVGLDKLLHDPDSVRRPLCAVVDMMMSWTSEIFNRYEIPAVNFFTSGACSAAMDYAMWKSHPLDDFKSGETRLLSGLPEEMAITVSDLKRQSRDGPQGGSSEGFPRLQPPRTKFGPQRHHPACPGAKPPWVEEVEPCVAVMINTCDDLEHPFIKYVSDKIEKPVWGVGPLLPEQYWKSVGSVLHDREIRTNRKSNLTDDEVNRWLQGRSQDKGYLGYSPRENLPQNRPGVVDSPLLTFSASPPVALCSCPHFASPSRVPAFQVRLVSPAVRQSAEPPPPPPSHLHSSTASLRLPQFQGFNPDPRDEHEILAEALEASARPFIWVVQANAGLWPGPRRPALPDSEPEEAYFPHGLDARVGKRGLIIPGWAPQLLILSHPSTGGFLSHCGWNSTVEAIGRGVPFLAWPFRGDQYPNAKLVVSHLKVGYLISEDLSQTIEEEDITRGIEKLLSDEDMKQRAVKLSAKFEHGFPTSSVAALDAFGDFLGRKNKASCR
ncbi:putative UDP-glucuronosyl/UDP-glucosyltransferase [Rosa chinensis]|uniref:Putative UDP-glucuronosyl/UDP-glucosyltransferase n=1 Tax=Rosa chinensis TaxID=74649 RepID=A0A2P6PAX5_ROSCH|nr:putative UDP-glucuronosyl/UDP-glucosyltransferase [Rosa chinensis]